MNLLSLPVAAPEVWLPTQTTPALTDVLPSGGHGQLHLHIKEQDAVLWLARTCISETRSNSRNFSVRCQHAIGPSKEAWIIKRLWTRELMGCFLTQPYGGFSLRLTSYSSLFPSSFTKSFHLGVSVLLPLSFLIFPFPCFSSSLISATHFTN